MVEIKNKFITYWAGVPFFMLGAFVGLMLLLAARVAYYDFMGFQPNIHPGIAFYLSPILLGVILIVALPVEALLRQIAYRPRSKIEIISIGASYSTLLSWWAFPPNWEVFIIFNPITCRWFVGRLWNMGFVQTRSAS